MNPAELGIVVTSRRDAGTLVQYTFGLPLGQEATLLTALLAGIASGCEISVEDPTNGDCNLEARRGKTGFEVKRGCHGAYGTWRIATAKEAHAWLLPGAVAAPSTARPGFGVTLNVPRARDGA